jgi:hypothetical protein
VTQKDFDDLYENHLKLRKQDGKSLIDPVEEGVPIKRELPPDDFKESECTKDGALNWTRDRLKTESRAKA